MINLQPVSFAEIKDDGKLAVYQARLHYPAVPGAPVYALTATTISPANTQEKAALLKVLNQMRAAFTIQDEPAPGKAGGKPEPFDPQNEIKLEPSLIEIGRPGPVSVGVTVEATIGADEAPTGVAEQNRAHTVTLAQYRDHLWHSSSGNRTQATVTVGLGTGTLSPPVPPNPIGPGNSYRTTGATVVVHADKRLEYTFGGSFKYPPT